MNKAIFKYGAFSGLMLRGIDGKGNLLNLLDDLLAVREKLEGSLDIHEEADPPYVRVVDGLGAAEVAKALAYITMAIQDEDYGQVPGRKMVKEEDLPF